MNINPQTTRELDHRKADGIDVRLLWSEAAGRLAVSVVDSRSGVAFALEVHDGESPREVFNHPYAYAAFHAVDATAVQPAHEPAVPLAA